MKITTPTVILLTALLTATVIFFAPSLSEVNAQTQGEPNIGAIGDVKWSLLPPTDFRNVNGNGWMLLAGDEIPNEDLADFGISKLPDARGCFLRALNGVIMPDGNMKQLRSNRAEQGDPEGDTRTVGSFQFDSFDEHSHEVLRTPSGDDGEWPQRAFQNLMSGDRGGVHVSKSDQARHNDKLGPKYIKDIGGSETRPRNIALYCYVKVNR